MSLTLWLIEKNLPLGHFEKYEDEYREEKRRGQASGFWRFDGNYWGEKKMRSTASIIVNGLSQYKVAELVAREWEQFHARLRLDVRDICNTETRSGNVSKGVAYLDKLLNGGVLKSQQYGPVRRDLVVIRGQLTSVNRRINPAVAGAERAHAAFVRPPNYTKMSPAEKRRVNQRMAAERRRDKKY